MRRLDPLRRLADLIGGVALAGALARHDSWTPAQLAATQRARFLRLVRHAAANAPFYRDLYRGIALDDDLDPVRLPPNDKLTLMTHLEPAVTDRRLRRTELEQHLAEARGDPFYLGRYRVMASSGTSGLRGIFVYDRPAWRVVIANTLRWHRLAGISPQLPRRTRICSIGADNPMHMTSRIPLSGNVGLFELRHIEAIDPIADQVAALNAFQPDVLVPYPSIAALLAHEQIEGRLAIHPGVVSTHSEVLMPEMSGLITTAWGTKPFNHYGLTEEPHVAVECGSHSGLHVLEDTVMLEVVDDDLQPVPDGTMGTRWLLTNLYNFTQPLIRYEVTDMVCRSPLACSCGRPFRLLDALGGRAEDMLHLPRRSGVGEVVVTPMVIGLAIESFVGVHDYAAEHDAAGIRMRLVVPDAAARSAIAAGLIERLRADLERQGAVPPAISLEFVPALPRASRTMGKHRAVGRHRGTAEVGRS